MQSNSAEDINDRLCAVAAVPLYLSQEDQARADLYALIARLLIAAPDDGLLASLANADSISSQQVDHPLDLSWEKLALTASILDPYAIQAEFNELFISIGTPKINPYASLYLSGFMNEKPLAALRAELAQMGLTRVAGAGELEDHLGALCETMRILITGMSGAKRQPIKLQKAFFGKYIAPWYELCLTDIRQAQGVNFYRCVADFIQAFFDIELQAFDMEAAWDDECA
jgi:TorA maturation chaperone TorD